MSKWWILVFVCWVLRHINQFSLECKIMSSKPTLLSTWRADYMELWIFTWKRRWAAANDCCEFVLLFSCLGWGCDVEVQHTLKETSVGFCFRFREVWGQLGHSSSLQLLHRVVSIQPRKRSRLCQTQPETRYASGILRMRLFVFLGCGGVNIKPVSGSIHGCISTALVLNVSFC